MLSVNGGIYPKCPYKNEMFSAASEKESYAFFPPPINLSAIFSLYLSSLFWNRFNLFQPREIFLNRKQLEGNIFLFHSLLCAQLRVTHRHEWVPRSNFFVLHFELLTYRKLRRKVVVLVPVLSIQVMLSMLLALSHSEWKYFDPVFWRQFSFHKNI